MILYSVVVLRVRIVHSRYWRSWDGGDALNHLWSGFMVLFLA
jgi:hypothetical protein